ncbi:hypothetical protein Tco_1086937, partial [Tanacetum coccineum]
KMVEYDDPSKLMETGSFFSKLVAEYCPVAEGTLMKFSDSKRTSMFEENNHSLHQYGVLCI